MYNRTGKRGQLAAEITKASSRQTFYTIRFFVDRELREDAYRAYAYFRWVDDVLDAEGGDPKDKTKFIERQKKLLVSALNGEHLMCLSPEENMLVRLVQNDTGEKPGLRSYLHRMMKVMEFDTERRGREISFTELAEYTSHLAIAVQDALFYFIGHHDPIPAEIGRYNAVTAAHITHMLRDTYEDSQIGYYNIPFEYLQQHDLSPYDYEKKAFRKWVCGRVELARSNFAIGREYISQVKNIRCRLAGFAYSARFEWVLDAIERDSYQLRPDYSQRKRLWAAIKIGLNTFSAFLSSLIKVRPIKPAPQPSSGIKDS